MDCRNVNSSRQDAASTGWLRAWCDSMTRNQFFAGLFFLGCVNGLAAKVISSIDLSGLQDALINTFDISAIVLIACAAGLWLMRCREEQSVTPTDLAVGASALALIALPIGGLSWLAVGELALYILLFADASPALRRGATIMLAVTVPMLWSKLLFETFANLILDIDASLVGWMLGTERTGNLVHFANGSGYLAIFPACSSLANMSLALLCWVTVSELAEHRRSVRDLWWCLLACGSVLAINVGRMSLMGLSVQHYETIHSEVGDAVAGTAILVVTLAWSLMGVRRELFSHD
jgi:exosortase/archaeosortase family protein